MKTQILQTDANVYLEKAAKLLKNGKIIAFPTETVYGLGALLFHESAKKEIYRVKNRPLDNPLIVHVACFSMLKELVDVDTQQQKMLAKLECFFPGPLTLVLPVKQSIKKHLQRDTIAIRMPNDPIALQLLELLQEPIVAPSANLSGKPSPTCAKDVLEDLEGKIPLIIDGGDCAVGIESTVLDLTKHRPTILRPGIICKDMLSGALQQPVCLETQTSNLSPGMKYRHYAPKADIIIFDCPKQIGNFCPENTLFLSYKYPLEPGFYPFFKKNLYSLFRKADTMQKSMIAIYVNAEVLLQEDLMNRINKASQSAQ